MPAAWPAALPPLPLNGLVTRPVTRLREFQPDAGRPIRAPATTVRLREIALSFRMKRAAFAVFEDFVWTTLQQATQEFTFRHPITGDTVLASFVGAPPYEATHSAGQGYLVTFTLSIRDAA